MSGPTAVIDDLCDDCGGRIGSSCSCPVLSVESALPSATDLMGVLGDSQKNQLTASKAAWIMKRDGSQVTGFVVTDKNGLSAIVYKSAVRWLLNDEMWWLMHESKSPLSGAGGVKDQ